MFVITKDNDDVIGNESMEYYTCDSCSNPMERYYEDTTKVNALLADLNTKEHALACMGDLYDRVDNDEHEYIELYAASEAMSYARLAGVADQITVGHEGLFKFFYNIISAIFKAIITLISKIVEFIGKLFGYIFGFAKNDGVDTPAGREERKASVEEQFKDVINEIIEIKKKGTYKSDHFEKTQQATIESLEQNIITMANNISTLKVFKDGVDSTGTINITSVLDVYSKHVNSIDNISHVLIESKPSDALMSVLVAFSKNNKTTNLIDIATNYVETLKDLENGDLEAAKDKRFFATSPQSASLITLIEHIYNILLGGSILANRKNLASLPVQFTKNIRDEVIDELDIHLKTRNRTILTIVNNKAYTTSTGIVIKSKLDKRVNDLKEQLKELKKLTDPKDRTPYKEGLAMASKFLMDLVPVAVVYLESNNLADLDSLKNIEITSVSTDDLEATNYDFSDTLNKILEAYSLELAAAGTVKDVKSKLSYMERSLEKDIKQLKKLEKDVDNVLKNINDKENIGKSITNIIKLVDKVKTAYATNAKTLSVMAGEVAVTYNRSKFYELCLEILKLYKNKFVTQSFI